MDFSKRNTIQQKTSKDQTIEKYKSKIKKEWVINLEIGQVEEKDIQFVLNSL